MMHFSLNLSQKSFTIIALLVMINFIPGLTARENPPFFPNGKYNSAVPTPEQVLGFKVGERPARYPEAVAYLKELARQSPRVQLLESGQTHEGRTLYYALISSEANLAKLDEYQSRLGMLADPRKIKPGTDIDDLIRDLPAAAWMMYSIHGDELSGADASLQLAYQLAAGEDTLTQMLRRELIIGIDPMENPDGRERFLGQMQQWKGRIPNSDLQSIQHTSVWPWGRTNHYLFDLNRDWFILSQPESRARVKALREWNPQVVVDAHEMGAYNTYLFPPAREPINPHFSPILKKWTRVFSQDQAKAFDRYGWSYYTGEWLEDWYPGYGSSYPRMRGAVAILYEQAGVEGSLIKRPDGTYLTYRESVHHQFVSSIANLATAARNRVGLLKDFYRMKRNVLEQSRKGGPTAFIIDPGQNYSRLNRLIDRLLWAGVELYRAEADFTLKSARSYWETQPRSHALSKGSLIIPLNQPLRPLIEAILEFDPRMTTKFLKSERESLERGEGTRLYEVSGWSMGMAYGLDTYLSFTALKVKQSPIREVPRLRGELLHPQAAYGFVIDYRNDRAVNLLFKLLDDGLKVRTAVKDFRVEGKKYPTGTLLLRRVENREDLADVLAEYAQREGVDITGVNTALSEEGTDLGGGNFPLLAPLRIAMLAGAGLSAYNLGHIWHLLDYEMGVRFTILNTDNFRRTDLRKYNVLVLPNTWRGPGVYKQLFGKPGLEKLKTWVKEGGTLIGVGNAAAFLADSSSGLSKVRLRRQALEELPLYQKFWQMEKNIGKTDIDSAAFWAGKPLVEKKPPSKPTKADKKQLAIEDERLRLFMPRGAILRVNLNERHWLSFGVGKQIPAIFYSSYAFLSRKPVESVGRFSEGERLRLSGLLWPEARERWENTAYLTRERSGNGQVILFAGEPNFRSYFYGTARLLLNSMVLGPGLGARQPVGW